MIEEIKKSALNNKVPIMKDEGIEFLISFIKKNKIKDILEIGTAVGYSAIRMASVSKDIKVTSIERDQERYLEAVKNIKQTKLEDRVHLIFNDALNVKLNSKFDLIFIDAAKGKNIEFFENFEKNLKSGGYIITDNLKFHGYVDMNLEDIESRNIRGLVRKIRKYVEFLKENKKYQTEFLELGDGISVSKRKD
ncbi:MAG: O-methyltransferase [Bacilli bacterium]